MLLKKYPVSSLAALSALLFAQSALAADTLTEALTGGKANANLQYRYEDVRNSTVPAAGTNTNVATAHTVRLRLGYTTDTFNGFGAMVEAESIVDLGNRKYNSGNGGNVNYASIPDPEITEMNQAFLSYSGMSNTTVKWGRQRIILDNARFIGNVGWRQNEQTFDALTLVNKSLPDTAVTAGYLTNANRIFGDGVAAGNAKMGSTIINAKYSGWSFAEIVGYVYNLDYDALRNSTSSDTYGIRLNGNAPMGGNKLLYTAEFASQQDGSNNANNYKTSYTLLEGGVDVTSIATFKLGYEVLGTDTGGYVKTAPGVAVATSFQTPLATGHAFNGWSDQFAGATPATGLKDTYVSANTKLAGIALGAVYHDFRVDSNAGGFSDLGKEWNLVATYQYDKNYSAGLKYADYKAGGTISAVTGNGNGGKPNTQKTWLWGAFNF
ncbi:MAG TPA: alginate export family protein [Gallionella sp.]|nr:alginate export family protein [Gallionella sp.]